MRLFKKPSFQDYYISTDIHDLDVSYINKLGTEKQFLAKKYIYINDTHEKTVWETLPSRSRKQVQEEIYKVFLNASLSARSPLIHKWYWPNGARSFFTFRADMDAGDEKSLLKYVDAVSPWAKSLSFFVCGKAYSGKEELLQTVAGLGAEIGNHTHAHYVFSKKDKNRINLELTEHLLASVEIEPKGYVGPASFFHTSMYDVLEEKGYAYTSSFGLAHDDFPFFPAKSGSAPYNMVEIPFHCLGDRFPKFGLELDSADVRVFFDQLLEKKYLHCEPMFIYGHPDMPGRMGDHPELVKHICKKALSYADVCTGNMADIAAWWKRRHEASADISYERENNRVVAKNYCASADVYWSIQIGQDCKYLVSGEELQKGICLDNLDIYKKIDLAASPYAQVGEAVESAAEKISLRTRVGNLRKEYRRKQRMIRELNVAKTRLKGVVS